MSVSVLDLYIAVGDRARALKERAKGEGREPNDGSDVAALHASAEFQALARSMMDATAPSTKVQRKPTNRAK